MKRFLLKVQNTVAGRKGDSLEKYLSKMK